MIDPKQHISPDEEEAVERKPEVEPETLKDLTTPEDDAKRVRGGDTGAPPGYDFYENGTA